MGFDKLVDIIKQAASRHPGFSKRLDEAEALSRWEAAVGPSISRHTRAIRVQDQVLWVEVDHPIWKSELHHRKRQILENLNGGRAGDATSKAKALMPAKDVVSDILFLDPRSGDPRSGAQRSR